MIINWFGFGNIPNVKAEAEKYLKFCAYELMGVEITRECTLNMHLGGAGCFDAQVEIDEIDCNDEHPRNFNMYIGDNIKGEDFLLTLCHEMVHVKQFALNELCETQAGRLQWKGLEYPKTMTKAEYYSSPWEIEAYGKENGLYWSCTEHYEMLDKLIEIAKSE